MSKLTNLIAKINKDMGEELASLGIKNYYAENKIPFSSPKLQWMTYGGIPSGILMEISGREGSSKTTLSLDLVANAQRKFPDKSVVYIDAENTLDANWAEKIGVDISNLILLSPTNQSAEWIFSKAIELLDTGEVSLMVIDSIGVLVSAQALEKTIEEDTMAGIAKALTNFSKQAVGLCKKYGTTLIGINQVRDVISYGGGVQTTGGNAWKHTCSIRLQTKRGDYIDEKRKVIAKSAENPYGNLVTVAVLKTKAFRNDRRVASYTLTYHEGIDKVNDAIEMAEIVGVISRAGAFYDVTSIAEGEPKIQGKEKLKTFLESNPEILDKLIERVYTVLNAENTDGENNEVKEEEIEGENEGETTPF